VKVVIGGSHVVDKNEFQGIIFFAADRLPSLIIQYVMVNIKLFFTAVQG
jgi:hypothetical protein